MATHIAPTFEGSQFVSGIPLDIIIQGGMMKDQQITQNITQFKEKFNRIASQPIANKSSADYISNALNEGLNKTNEILSQGGIDFSKQENIAQLEGAMSSVIGDEEFKRRFKNDLEVTSAMNKVDMLKQTGSEDYSDKNAAVFYSHVNKYLQDENANKMDYRYVNKVDITENLQKALKNVKPEQVVTRVPVYHGDGRGGYITTYKDVTETKYSPERIRQVIIEQLNGDSVAQMQVDYDYQMLNSTEEDVKNQYVSIKEISNENITQYQKELDRLNLLKKDDMSENEKTDLTKRIKIYENQISLSKGYYDQADLIIKDVESGNYSFKDKFKFSDYMGQRIDGMVGQYAITEKIDSKYDDGSMEWLKYNFKLNEKEIEHQYRVKEMDLKNAYDITLENIKNGLGPNSNINNIPGKNGVKFSDASARIEDEVLNTFVNVEFTPNGEYVGNREILAYMVSGGKSNNGVVRIDVNKNNSFLSLGDIVDISTEEGIKINNDNQYYENNKKYLDAFVDFYYKDNPNYGWMDAVTQGDVKKRMKDEYPSLQPLFLGSYKNNLDYQYMMDSQEKFIKSEEYKSLNLPEDFKYDSKFEKNNKKNIVENNKKMLTEDILSQGGINIGLTDFEISTDKGNIIKTNDGNYYINGTATLTEQQLKQSFDVDDIKKIKGYDEYIKNGTIRQVGVNKESGNNNWQIRTYVRTTPDLEVAHTTFYRDKLGDKSFDSYQTARAEQFRSGMTALQLNKIVRNEEALNEILSQIDTNLEYLVKKELIDEDTKNKMYSESVTKSLEFLSPNNTNLNSWEKLDKLSTLGKLASTSKETLEELVTHSTGGRVVSKTTKGVPLDLNTVNSTLNLEPSVVSGKRTYYVSEPISVQHNFGTNHKLISAFMDATAIAEGGEYDMLYDNGKFVGFKEHPTELARTKITSGPNKGKDTTAAGKYQFVISTWQPLAKDLKLTDFSPKSQDIAAWELINREKIVTESQLKAASISGVLKLNQAKFASQWESILPSKSPSKFTKAFEERTGIKVIWI